MDNYLEQSVIGRGQFGTVSLATRISDYKSVVIKKIPLDSSDPRERDSALNEARLLKVLNHPNIIQYFESFIGERDTLMIVMEYARGGTLANYLAQQIGQFIDEEIILYLFSQMVLAIAYIHARNILHRDLKPQNIMLDETMRIVKLGDFGISTVLTTKTKATTVVGTPNYLGPEVCEGRPYNQKSDIWSLGCVLFEMMALHRAFDGSNLGAIVTSIQKAKLNKPLPGHYSEYLKKLVNLLLEKNPHYRPTAAQVLAYPPVMLATTKVLCSVGKILSLPNQLAGNRTTFLRYNYSAVSDIAATTNIKHAKTQQCSLITTDDTFKLPTRPGQQISKVAVGGDFIAGVFAGSGKPFIWEETDRLATITEYSLRLLHLDVNLVVTEVACGENFAVALSERGLILTTGSGCYGCLGHGTFHDITGSWRIVDGLLGSRIVAVSCGSRHVLALGEEGELFGWGESSSGRLGRLVDGNEGADGTTMMINPKKIDLSSFQSTNFQVSKIFCGNDCSCLLLKHDLQERLGCSGLNRANRLLLGDKCQVALQFTEAKLPENMFTNGDVQIAKICFGMKHAVLLTSNGQVFGWGDNAQNQLRSSCGNKKSVPDMVPLMEGAGTVLDISCGDFFTATLSTDGGVKLLGESMLESFGHWNQSCACDNNNNSRKCTISTSAAAESKLLVIVECQNGSEDAVDSADADVTSTA